MEAKNVFIGVIIALILILSSALVTKLYFPEVKVEVEEKPFPVYINNTVEKLVEVPVEIIKNVTVEKIVEVDNEKLSMVLEFIEDHKDMDFSDLVSDDFGIVEAMEFYNVIEQKAENVVIADFISILDDEDKFDTDLVDYRKSEIYMREIVKVEVVDVDYEDKDAEVEVTFKIRAKESGEASEYFTYKASLEFDNYSLDSVELI